MVGQRQPKITMGRWSGWDLGGQTLTWLAALLVNPVLWPGTANEKPTRPVLREKLASLAWFPLHYLSSLCKSRAFLNIIVTLSSFK